MLDLDLEITDQPSYMYMYMLCFSYTFDSYNSTGATKDDFSGLFFRSFEIIIFGLVGAICDLVHAVAAMYGLP